MMEEHNVQTGVSLMLSGTIDIPECNVSATHIVIEDPRGNMHMLSVACILGMLANGDNGPNGLECNRERWGIKKWMAHVMFGKREDSRTAPRGSKSDGSE